jgi:hypothetical protein
VQSDISSSDKEISAKKKNGAESIQRRVYRG